jgi:hypothetical protein
LEGFVKGRIAASIVLAVGIVMGTAGCNLIAPQATLRHYDASDGVGGSVGDIDVRNAILISDTGKAGNLVVTLVNTGDSAHLVNIKHGNSEKVKQVSVKPGAIKVLGGPTDQRVVFNGIKTEPGALYPVYFQYGDETVLRLRVPVLDGSLPEYQDYSPTSAVSSSSND